MQVVTGTMGSLLPKLGELLREEYRLHKGVKKDIRFLSRELTMMHAALCKVAEVPPDDLDPQLRLWAAQVRELSYDMEDIVDTFLVRVDNGGSSRGLATKIVGLLHKGRTRHQIAKEIRDIKDRVQEVADRRDRYKVDSILARSTATVDPRISALYKKATDLVGVDGARDELIRRLSSEGGDVNKALKVVSVAGPGGLGKTTLAKAVYDTLKEQFDCCAFVPLGRNPSTRKVLQDILLELNKQEQDMKLAAAALDERQLINQLIEFLKDKRYIVVLDDIWDLSTWEVVRNALEDNNCGSRIVATTRISAVAKEVGDVYNLEPLSNENSKKLFYTRIFGGEGASVVDHEDSQMDEAPDKILKKCGGVPLSIITIASLLVGKPRKEWSKVYDSIGFGSEDNRDVHNTRKILSFSYYDLPSHLKPCLLYLSLFPEDYNIEKNSLIWRWIAEGFVCEKQGVGQYEVGERYFNDLINRSMIEPTELWHNDLIVGCRVHDMVLDLIRSLSTDENFVAILDKEQDTLPESNVRRLAVQKRNIAEHNNPKASVGMPQVRSFSANTCTITVMPQLSSFRVLRVLAVESCDFTEKSYRLKHLGKLLHLRYLSLVNTPIDELPREVGSLKFLQGLDVRGTGVEELPSTVGELKQLICLRADGQTRVPAGMGNLTKLEELLLHSIDKSPSFVAELAELTEVRDLKLWFHDHELGERSQQGLVSSMCSLRKVHTVEIWCGYRPVNEWAHIGGDWEGWDPSSQLRLLSLISIFIPRVPSWMDTSRVPHLSHLHLGVELVEASDMDTLGRLPELRFLYLATARNTLLYRPAGSDDGRRPLFRNLRYFQTNMQLMFPRGAMPELLVLREFGVSVRSVADAAAAGRTGFDDVLGVGNLPLLERVHVLLYCAGARLWEVEEAEATLRRAIRMHPNSPASSVGISKFEEEEMILDDPLP
nr:unnamed protein product [Digitaria exilis]